MNELKTKILAISYRNRSIKTDDEKWYRVAAEIDLDSIERGREYQLKVHDGTVLEIVELEKTEPTETTVWDFKDWRISRLAAIDRAIQFLAAQKKKFDLEEVFEISDQIVDYVYRGKPPKKV